MERIIRKYIRESFQIPQKDRSPLYGKIYFTFRDLGVYHDTESGQVFDKELEKKLEELPIYKQFNSYDEWFDNIISRLTNLNFSRTTLLDDASKRELFNIYLSRNGPFILKRIS